MTMSAEKLACASPRCGWRGDFTTVLRALDPFNPGGEIFACPTCRDAANPPRACCSAPGCYAPWAEGNPTPDGYRFTCHLHSPLAKLKPVVPEIDPDAPKAWRQLEKGEIIQQTDEVGYPLVFGGLGWTAMKPGCWSIGQMYDMGKHGILRRRANGTAVVTP